MTKCVYVCVYIYILTMFIYISNICLKHTIKFEYMQYCIYNIGEI